MRTPDEQDVAHLLAANDRVLAPVIGASGEERRAAIGAVLVAHARPVIDRVIARFRAGDGDGLIGTPEAEDLVATVLLRLVRRLQNLAEDQSEAVASLADFTATLTFNAVYDFMRRRFPERTRLKNRVRYVVTRDARFRSWNTDHGPMCALAGAPSGRTQVTPERVADAVEALLVSAKRPLLVDDVVRSLAELWNVVDQPPAALTETEADPMHSAATHLENRQYLATLWREIRELRGPQRAALLLNLRDADGGNAVALFVLAGIATHEEIAAALELSADRLRELWTDLPLDDLAIAARLGLTRQQVINLRKAARARLARRMGP
ncbi:MAG TPA: hypothetical protein VF432_24355 [Thermoanaerobaculia bacterium]